jgi:hypothetical protein
MSHQVCLIFLLFNQSHRTVNSRQPFVPLDLIVQKGKFSHQEPKQILALTIVTARLTYCTTDAKTKPASNLHKSPTRATMVFHEPRHINL